MLVNASHMAAHACHAAAKRFSLLGLHIFNQWLNGLEFGIRKPELLLQSFHHSGAHLRWVPATAAFLTSAACWTTLVTLTSLPTAALGLQIGIA